MIELRFWTQFGFVGRGFIARSSDKPFSSPMGRNWIFSLLLSRSPFESKKYLGPGTPGLTWHRVENRQGKSA
ncbi:hypothetical protein [Streptomyces sp. TS71-3]|uniref:hypothetical protein n=1 Tax=Streptomyces sp. TS71-3 TaxID=2733862 RepID=UPI001BB359AC|nr:hypothetical protein [Streptomyces sp. TS71-3]